jgi:hypothetical protein
LQTESYGAKMQTMRETWTDARLDDLNGRVSDGFQRLDVRIDLTNGEVRELRTEMNARFDAVQRTTVHTTVALAVGMLAGFGGLAGLIATQL